VVEPLYLSAAFEETDDVDRRAFTYSRYGNPTVRRLEDALAGLEGAEAGAAFSSGMGAIHAVLATLAERGAAVVVSRHVYPGTEVLLARLADRSGLDVRYVDPDDEAALAVAVGGARLVWLESPANPTLHVPDVARVARRAHAAGALVAVDATLATPGPGGALAGGADLSVHSLTKYVSGGGDVLGGAVLGRARDVELVRRVGSGEMGNVLSAFNAFLLLRGLDSLATRIAAQSASAARLAGVLGRLLGSAAVRYPGERDGQGRHRPYGGVVLFRAPDPAGFAARLDDSSLTRAPSLGDARTLVSLLRPETFPPVTRGALEAVMGPAPGLVRLSVGLEAPAALERELLRLLDPGSAP
jgi:cystathionine beta-lyase/cystathionine gamma-synthase